MIHPKTAQAILTAIKQEQHSPDVAKKTVTDEIIYFPVQAVLGVDIADAVRAARDVAWRLEIAVEIQDFNGVNLFVHKNSDIDKVVAQYEAGLKRNSERAKLT